MDDECPDGKTKMQHIQHMLSNMVTHFIALGTTSSVVHTLTIIGFDNEVGVICENELISSALVEKMPALLLKLEPRGMTDIGKAFDYVAEHVRVLERAQDSQTVHIFMTDGQITSGERDSMKLLEKLNESHTTNILVGFGSDHSDKLLRDLSNAPKGEYHFVESLENAGMVYGEIIHNRLHECAENIEITVANGEIYDYKSNAWLSELSVDTLASNQERTWHIRKPWMDGPSHTDCSIRITYETGQGSRQCQGCIPGFPEDSTDKNVEKYWWRQRTQELMNDVSNFMESGKPPCHRYVGGDPELPLAPPPSPLVRSHNVENASVVIDAASQEQWEVVWTILDSKPSLIDKRPEACRFSLIHVAAFQGNDNALTNLLERGATASALTEDRLSAKQIAAMNNYHSIVGILTRHETTGSMLERIPRLLSRILNEFMSSMKMYMKDNDLGEDPFMGNLCDDIYVSIRSLNSRLGAMYLGARVSYQGSQRAYNLTNLTQMDTVDDADAMYPAPPGLRHAMSQNPNSVYASPQTVDTMDALSSPSPPALQWQMSVDTEVYDWSPPYVRGSTATQAGI